MSNPNILFKGIPRSPTRGYTKRYLEAVKPDVVVVPCTGSFALAYVAREAGILGKNIFCGDISLYSTALGRAFMNQDWRLDIKETAPDSAQLIAPYLTDPLSKAAAILWMIRLLQYEPRGKKPQTRHKGSFQTELQRNIAVYIQQIKTQIAEYGDLLTGITYQAQDMWLTLEQFKSNPKAVLLTNPPRYTGGYDRMFAGIDGVFDWDQPEASQFTEKDYGRLMDTLAHEPAHTLMYYATQGEDPAPQWNTGHHQWKSLFADLPNNKGAAAAINWIVGNHDAIKVDANRARIYEGKPKFALFKGEVKPTSELRAVKVDKVTGDYYRDLFIHKLPGSVTEVYVGLLLDGYLMGIIGLHLADMRRGKVIKKGEKVLDHCASVTFAFTAPQERYKLLHKLTLGSLISTWFWDDILGQEKTFDLDGAPKHVKTTMLTQHPENKTARGIMKLDTREEQADGTYKLTYSTATLSRTREETLVWWLSKFAGEK